MLMLVGVYGLVFEFTSPGAVLPGVIGGICLLLGLYALHLLPINYAGLALMLLGIAFLVIEAFVPRRDSGWRRRRLSSLGAAMLRRHRGAGLRHVGAVIGPAAALALGLALLSGTCGSGRRARPAARSAAPADAAACDRPRVLAGRAARAGPGPGRALARAKRRDRSRPATASSVTASTVSMLDVVPQAMRTQRSTAMIIGIRLCWRCLSLVAPSRRLDPNPARI